MKTILEILVVVPSTFAKQGMQHMEMDRESWLFVEIGIAIFLMIYLIISLIKPDKFN